ncbi:hypothetical protein [Nitrosopumilus sp.]|nr:hypothetical protein [Nitrosopumilus sp.]
MKKDIPRCLILGMPAGRETFCIVEVSFEQESEIGKNMAKFS